MTAHRAGFVGLMTMSASLWAVLCFAAADVEKLLTEPGVYGTFAAYTLNEDWAKRDGPTRIALLSVLKGVVEQHREKIAIDLYLLRGLSDHADILFRGHANELRDIQKFLLDLEASPFGKHLTVAGIMHGLTKKANYVPGFPDDIKADQDSKRPRAQAVRGGDSDKKERRLVGAGPRQPGGDDEGAHPGLFALS
jgi:chlorite dismutase